MATKQEILKTHKMTEKEFYEKFPTLEAYNQFQMGGSLSPKQKFQMGGITPLPVDVPASLTAPVPTFTPGTSAPAAAAPGGFKLPNMSGMGGGQQAPQQAGSDPNAPVKKNTGKTIGGVVGGIAGVALAPFTGGISTVVGPALGSAIGGGIDDAQYKNKTEDYNAVKSSQQNAMTSNIAGNFNPSAQGKQFKMGGNFTEYHGNTHENGGIPIGKSEVEDGETNWKGFINSDSPEIADILKPILKGKTPAQATKEVVKRYAKRNGAGDKITESSQNRELDYIKKLGSEALAVLEGNTGLTNNSRGMFQDGGPLNTKDFQDWMDVNNPTWLKGKPLNQGGGYGTYGPNTKKAYKDLGNVYEARFTPPEVVDEGTDPVFSNPVVNENPEELLNPSKVDNTVNSRINILSGRFPKTPGSFGYDTPKQQPGAFNFEAPKGNIPSLDTKASKFIGETKGKYNYNPVSPVDTNKPLQTSVNPLGYLASAIGPAYNIAQGLRGGDPVNFDRMTSKYQYADPKGAMAAASRGVTSAYNSAKNAARNTATSSGEYLANMGSLTSKEGMDRAASLAGIKSQYDIANTQGLNQTNLTKDQFNAQVQMRESEARQQEQDAARSSISQGLNNFGQNTLGYGQDRAMNKTQNTMLPLLADGYEYVIDADGKVSAKKKISGTDNKYQLTKSPGSI